MNKVVKQDLERIYNGLTEYEKLSFKDITILLTGGAGFLGFYFINFMAYFKKELKIKKIICLDNFLMGYPKWIKMLENKNLVEVHTFDVIKDDIGNIPCAAEADYIYHMASIASPLFYRKYPLETLDANIWGLRNLLEYYSDKNIKGFVFYSSSEIYGDPDEKNIPTAETYRGYVDCQGPRACYDESKRLGETMCYIFNKKYNMPITVIRPFNNYGPGMKLNDARVPADFAKAILENKDITIFSDGTPTRTFCYISDAIIGDLKGLIHARDSFEVYNIGIDYPEISIKELALIYQKIGKELFGYTGNVIFGVSADDEYLINNPNRRCPVIKKAREKLGYNPQIEVEEGVRYFLEFIKLSDLEDLIW